MALSPTPSLDSMRGSNSIESYGDNNDYLSDSPLTLSRASPPECDSGLCEEFTSKSNTTVNQHNSISGSVSSSSSSSSGLSGCGSTISSDGNNSPGVNGIDTSVSNNKESPCNLLPDVNVKNLSMDKKIPRCTACKSTQLNAVAKCFDCVSYLCSNCVTAHEFMHCFNGHNVCAFKNKTNDINTIIHPLPSDFKFANSLAALAQQKQSIHQKQLHLSQLSKIVMNSASISNGRSSNSSSAAIPLSICSDNSYMIDQPSDMFDSTGTIAMGKNPLFCHRHNNELLKYNCRSCCALACTDCVLSEHTSGMHEIENIQEHSLNSNLIMAIKNIGVFNSISDQSSLVQSIIAELRGKLGDLVNIMTNADSCLSKLKMQYQKAHNEVNETYQFFCSMLDERKQELLKELELLYSKKVASSNNWVQRSKELMEKTIHTCETLERSPKPTNVGDLLMLRKTLDIQLQVALEDVQVPFELEFSSNYQSIQNEVRNNFGCIQTVKNDNFTTSASKQPPIARPIQQNGSNSGSSNSSTTGIGNNLSAGLVSSANFSESLYKQIANSNGSLLGSVRNGASNSFDDTLTKPYQLSFSNSTVPQHGTNNTGSFLSNPYEKWSNGCPDSFFSVSSETISPSHMYSTLNGSVLNGSNGVNSLDMVSANNSNDSLMDLTAKLFSASIYPPKSQIKRQKMIYHCKFGEFGVMEGQFTEPSGVAVNAQNDIIVADTNNHRIQIFDKEGRFKFQFGECGKRDSQLLYPNRVSVVRSSGDIIVTERSPTHQIQIYNQYGQFVRKFGANILQHPRGVTVDNKGRIIVVECKVMRVIIFDQNGNVLHKFGCSKHLEFPNGVVVNDNQEIFISDNRAHCVKVFNYEGQFLRQIGGEGVTNYPIGVGININGEILIADNHNNFNLTIFTQDGQLVSALESKVKHAQCFDVALMDDGSVVLASKDYRLYIYRYVQMPSVGS